VSRMLQRRVRQIPFHCWLPVVVNQGAESITIAKRISKSWNINARFLSCTAQCVFNPF